MADTTVLLLDDDPTMLLVLRAVLEKRSLNVLETADEKGALAHCQTSPDGIHLLIADVVLRYSNGPGVVRRVKYLQPHMRILFISGFAMDDLERRNLLHPQDLAPGHAEFLQKPFTAEALLSSVDQLLAN